MTQDIVIYFSFTSKMDYKENNERAKLNWGDRILSADNYPHLMAATQASKILKENHIPFGVISEKKIDNLDDYKTLILPNVLNLNNREIEKIISYVKNGGNLYASGPIPQNILKEIFNIEYKRQTNENGTYMVPFEDGKRLFVDSTELSPLFVGSQVIVESDVSGSILAKIALPYTNPKDQSKFSSIHSDPPGKFTDYPSVVFRKYGKGNAIWAAFPIEKIEKDTHIKTFLELIKKITTFNFSFESDAPYPVEIIMHHQPEKHRFIINLINEQESMPLVPIYNFNIKIYKQGKKVNKVFSVTYDENLNFNANKEFVKIKVPKLEMFNMLLIQY
jgi:hypothetical protein